MFDPACKNPIDGSSYVRLVSDCSHNVCECVQLELNSCQV